MKILVVSMLRLGDLVMATQAVSGLKKKFPESEVHLLTNRSNHPIARVLNVFDKCHYFERNLCQKSIGNTGHSVFEAVDRINDLVKRLNHQGYDKIINLTQNKISAQLCGMIKADDYCGMITSENNVTHLSSVWFRHLNNYIAGSGADNFHYIDFFRMAAELDLCQSQNIFSKPQKACFPEHKNRIVIQAWSSDEKKDYSQQNWKNFFTELAIIKGKEKVSILAAPNESERLNDFIEKNKSSGMELEPVILTFEELIDYLPRQDLLISVDTSVKHVAGSLGVKTLELALGSSNPSKTGVYAAGSLLVKSRASCAPCEHSKPCHQKSYLCEESIEPRLLAMVTHEFLMGNWPSLRVLAEEYRDQVYIGRVGITQTGLWYSQSLHPIEWQSEKEKLVNLESWKFTLNRKYLELKPPFAEVASALAPTLMDPQKLMVDRLESVSRQCEMNVDRVSRQVHEAVKELVAGKEESLSSIRLEIKAIESDLKLGDYLSQSLNTISTNGISSIRSLRESLNELRNFQVAKTNILRNMQKIQTEGQI